MRVLSVHITNLRSIVDSGQIELGPITLLVGQNNTGKSTIIRSLHAPQQSGVSSVSDVRYGETETCTVAMQLQDLNLNHWQMNEPAVSEGVLTFRLQKPSGNVTIQLAMNNRNIGVGPIPATEPLNFVYPYLSSRKVTVFDQTIDLQRSLEVRANLSNLAPKVDRLMDVNHPAHEEFRALVRTVINLPLSAIASGGGKQVGMWIDSTEWIPIEQMGDGVAQMLGLITQLCMAKDKLFLIEELETDMHPEGLKAVLRVIEAKSAMNQFVISTHNNIVLRFLGALPSTKVYEVTSDIRQDGGRRLPFTDIRLVGNEVSDRSRMLTSLGYELSDLDLYDGWLILEESSAERVIRDYLIPWFTPALSRIRTVAARGTGDLEPTFEALNKLVLFTHLQERYRGRVLVLADNEPSGQSAIQRLRATYANWPENSFALLDRTDFELYFPEPFLERVNAALTLPHAQKRQAKKTLLSEVLDWIAVDPPAARDAFEQSAGNVIRELKRLEAALSSPADAVRGP